MTWLNGISFEIIEEKIVQSRLSPFDYDFEFCDFDFQLATKKKTQVAGRK